jgi:hypothetical protein
MIGAAARVKARPSVDRATATAPPASTNAGDLDGDGIPDVR